MIDIRQSIHYANYMKRVGWIVEREGEINYFIKKFPLLGGVLKVQRPDEIRINKIDNLCRKYGIFQIIIEPKTDFDAKFLNSIGYKLSKNPYLPSKTLHIDLTKSRAAVSGAFKKDARSAIKRGGAFTIKTYSSPDEIKSWRKSWRASVNLERFVPGETQLINLRKSFPHDYSIFLASHNISGRIIGGALFTRSSHDIGYYWYGFTNQEGRTSLSQYTLLYQGILWAKKQGCKIFDFEGIYDPRFPIKSWLGFSHFKKSFGGYEIEYPGAFVKYRLPFTYA